MQPRGNLNKRVLKSHLFPEVSGPTPGQSNPDLSTSSTVTLPPKSFSSGSGSLKRAVHKLELLHCVRPQGVSADGSLPRRKAGLLLRSPQVHKWTQVLLRSPRVEVQPVTYRVGKVDAGTMYGTDTTKQCRSIHIGSICNHET